MWEPRRSKCRIASSHSSGRPVLTISGQCRGAPCGSGSVSHCCGTDTRMRNGEAQPVVVAAGCRRRATCVFSAVWPLCCREIGDSVTFTNACVPAILGTRCTFSRWNSPARRRAFCDVLHAEVRALQRVVI
ncbi:hypothetical protein TcCL_Unassigned01359 [Trypanosoma cruzi]|nr:hypothetical protein TcCL_Unassigned01359 [Trypanosoma cruzi]